MRASAKTVMACVFMLGLLGISACGEIKEYKNCQDICNLKRQCGTSSYDTSKCLDYCKSNYDADSDYAHKVDECQACTSGRACAEVLKCFLSCPNLP